MTKGFIAAVLLALAASTNAADLKVPLVFQPQEAVASNELPSLSPSLLSQPIALQVVDGRGDTSNRIGQGTDDDDATFIYVSEQPVAPFVQAVANALAGSAGIHTDSAAPLQLKLQLTTFSVDESNKAVGSMYGADVKFGWSLSKDRKVLAEGAVDGGARRYGQSASAANATEVLSDATKQAFASVLGDANLQTAWRTGAPATQSVSSDSVEARLERLDILLREGKISPEEHKQARADVLKGI